MSRTTCGHEGLPFYDGNCYVCAKRALGLMDSEPEKLQSVELVALGLEPEPQAKRCRRQADGTCDRHGLPMLPNGTNKAGKQKYCCSRSRAVSYWRAGRRTCTTRASLLV